MADIGVPVVGVRCQVWGVRYRVLGVGCRVSGVRCCTTSRDNGEQQYEATSSAKEEFPDETRLLLPYDTYY